MGPQNHDYTTNTRFWKSLHDCKFIPHHPWFWEDPPCGAGLTMVPYCGDGSKYVKIYQARLLMCSMYIYIYIYGSSCWLDADWLQRNFTQTSTCLVMLILILEFFGKYTSPTEKVHPHPSFGGHPSPDFYPRCSAVLLDLRNSFSELWDHIA